MAVRNEVPCRFCAELKTLSELVDLDLKEGLLEEIFLKLRRVSPGSTSLLISCSNLPKTVCTPCMSNLNDSFNFVKTLEAAQPVIQRLRSIKVEKEQEKEPNSVPITETDVKLEVTEADSDFSGYDVKFESIDYELDLSVVNNNTSNIYKNDKKCSRNDRRITKSSTDSSDDSTASDSPVLIGWNGYRWKCSLCGMEYHQLKELHNHSMSEHSVCNPYVCVDCHRKARKLDTFHIHVRKHPNRKDLRKYCHVCNKRFNNISLMRLHLLNSHTKKMSCPGCCSTFKTKDQLEHHKRTFFYGFEKNSILIANGSLTCHICEKTFKEENKLYHHIRSHNDPGCICDICGALLKGSNNLRYHMRSHEELRKFKCDLCEKTFKTNLRLTKHVQTHSDEKPFACEECGRCFRLKEQLKNHKIIHTDLLPFPCSICNRRFRFKHLVTQHMRQHTGSKPYSCDECDRTFTNWGNMNKHMIRRHGISKSKRTLSSVQWIDVGKNSTGDEPSSSNQNNE